MLKDKAKVRGLNLASQVLGPGLQGQVLHLGGVDISNNSTPELKDF